MPCLIPKILRVKKPLFLERAKGFEYSTRHCFLYNTQQKLIKLY